MSAMTVTMTSGSVAGGTKQGKGRATGGARVVFAYARNLAARSMGCWIAYLIAWLLVTVFPFAYVAGSPADGVASGMPLIWQSEYAVCLIGCAIGSIAAACRTCGYAFRRSEADFAGALPCRRPGLFAATSLAGFVPLLVVLVIVFVLLALLALAFPAIGLAGCARWLALACIFTCVFYATALLCVQLSGRASSAVWLFVGANAFIVVVELVVRFLAELLVWGADLGASVALAWTSPFLGIWSYGLAGNGAGSSGALAGAMLVGESSSQFDLVGSAYVPMDWGVLGLYCAAGAVFCLAAFLLNGIRPLERAGEAAPYRAMRIVWSCAGGIVGALVLAVCAALVASNASGAPLGTVASVAVSVCAAVGAFAGAVFLSAWVHDDVGKFHIPWKLGCAMGCVVLVAGLSCAFDVLHVESHVPDAAQVERVEVVQPYGGKVRIENPGNVEVVLQAHELLTELGSDARRVQRDEDRATTTVELVYALQNGATLRRSYTIPTAGKRERAALDELTDVFNSTEGIDSRLAQLRAKGARSLDISYAPDDGDDDMYGLTTKENVEFIEGPLASDAHAHGVLDVDLATGGGDGFEGSCGEVDINSNDSDEASNVNISILVSKEESPAIYRWLEKAGHIKR